LAALIAELFKPRHIPAVVGVLIAFSVGFQFQQMNTYRRDWDVTREFFWQLVWRAPQLRPGTLILTYHPPTQYLTDNSLTALLNWVYDPNNHGPKVGYKLFDLAYRANYLPNLELGKAVEHLGFSGSTAQAVTLYASEGSCLRVLSPEDASIPYLPEELGEALPLTNLDQILPGNPVQPPVFLGPEPEHGWCYSVIQADLAAQQGDWEEVRRIYEAAAAQGMAPLVPAELTVFIKGYAQTGDLDQALALSDQAIQIDTAIRPLICQVWRNLRAGADAEAWMDAQRCP